MEEIWRPVPGYEGAYEISNMGRLRSLTRTRIVNNCHGGTSPRTDKSLYDAIRFRDEVINGAK